MTQEDKLIVDYILEIDSMGTVEFCKYSGYPVPVAYNGVTPQVLAQQFIGVDAVRWKKIVEYAKLIRRSKPPEDNDVKEWLIRDGKNYINSEGEMFGRTGIKDFARVFTIEEATIALSEYKKKYPDQMFTVIPK